MRDNSPEILGVGKCAHCEAESAPPAAAPCQTRASAPESPACEGNVPCGHCRKKERGEKEYRDLLNRLSRIEGQVRGIRGMIERDAYCADVLTQVAAANAALNSFTRVLLSNHIKTCVARDIREGNDNTVDELVGLLQKLMK